MLPELPTLSQVLPALVACAVFRLALTCLRAARDGTASRRARRLAAALTGVSLAVTLGGLLLTALPGGVAVWIALGCVAWCVLMAEETRAWSRDP